MKTINVNGADVPMDVFMLINAKAALRILSIGMKIRHVNLKTIKLRLAEQGIVLRGKTAKDCLDEVLVLLAKVN
mgnify:CR=1 FL=1